jgi:hypothetical protein
VRRQERARHREIVVRFIGPVDGVTMPSRSRIVIDRVVVVAPMRQ